MSARPRNVALVGGGLVGSLLAVVLARRGHRVDIYERRPDPRKGTAGRGRSINLAISNRGLHALGLVGLDKPVVAASIPMRGRMIHPPDGVLHFQPYGHEAHHVIHSVSRASLNRLLLESAEALPNVRVHFGHRCTRVDLETATCTFEEIDSRRSIDVRADLVAGADGAFSEVRHAMQLTDRFEYSQSFLGHGYKELTIPAGPGGAYPIERNALHIWPRGGFMMIALPNLDGSFTCTCFWPFEGENAFGALQTETQVLDYFRRVFPDAVPLMPTLAEDFLQNPVGSLVTVRCRPWHFHDRALILGDAAHAIVPFYGQGANAGFEDVALLDGCLERSGDDLARAFDELQALRKEHVDALADLAIANFYEMRDKTASRTFLLGKKLEKWLHRLLPFWYVPLYYMVTFSRTPYADAVRRANWQWKVVRRGAAVAALLVILALAALWMRT